MVFVFIQTSAKAVFRPCQNRLFLSRSVYLVFSYSRVFCLYCVFSPNPCNIITGHSIHWPFLIQLHANTFTHTLHSLSLAAPPFLSRSVTHINSPTPPPQTNLSRSLHWPTITRSHSLETIVKQLKHSGSIKSPHHSRGGWRLQKSYWQKAMNQTERMAEFQTQENCNVPRL